MKIFITAASLALSMLIGTSALAAKPATGLDCGTLSGAITDVDTFLDGIGVQYPNLGVLVSTAILDPSTGGFLTGLINWSYNHPGQEITLPPTLDVSPFTSAKQVISTAAGCGLTPVLIREIND